MGIDMYSNINMHKHYELEMQDVPFIIISVII